jgi:hypothetical protein
MPCLCWQILSMPGLVADITLALAVSVQRCTWQGTNMFLTHHPISRGRQLLIRRLFAAALLLGLLTGRVRAGAAGLMPTQAQQTGTADSAVQNEKDVQALEPGQAVERDVAGREAHTCRLALQAGQFVRVLAEQKALTCRSRFATPDGKQVVEVNLTRYNPLESLSAEAVAGGDYRLMVRALGPGAPSGTYLLRVEARQPPQRTGSGSRPSD